ncbi:MAG: VWA domain-containing protein [Chloroflexales bacterium]|nr:VWA domain-containing protein [Chloroflexales bacterium]
MILHNPQFLALLLLIPVLILIWRWRGMRLVPAALALRIVSIVLLVLALADPIIGQEIRSAESVVFLVDQSDSLTPSGQATLRAEAARLAQESGSQSTTLWFGNQVVAVDSAQDGSGTTFDPALSEAQLNAYVETLDPSASDLETALHTARELLAPGGGRVVILSDGYETSGDVLNAAQQAAAAGLTIDVMPVMPTQSSELRITAITAPQTLRVGEEYPIQIFVANEPGAQNSDDATATLRLWEGEQILAEQEVALTPGANDFTFRHRATEPGVARLRAEIVGTPDTYARNNSAAATALVAPPPRVLLVEGRSGNARALSMALLREGIENQTIVAERLPTRLSDLGAYNGMVLVDVPSAALSLDQMASVREFVRSEGRGLVATGGRNSFGLGAYKDTPLEQTLPVLMNPPPRPQRSEIALLLIIDRSASMTAALGVSKFDMAKEAAILSTESLQAEDSIGILSFDTGQLWVVPFQRIGQGLSLEQIQDAIARLPSGGGTDIFAALQMGLNELARQPVSVRHAVLLTDGRSFTNDRLSYQQLVDTARAQDITLSTIAIGLDSDTDLLDLLAQWGGGRYYYADSPEDIPRLTLLESEIARADPSIEETFRAGLAEAHPLVRDFAPADFPQLDGYVATTPKDAAEVVLRSPLDDPVLTAWQYGLGRAVAWTPSLDAPWAGAWVDWLDYDRFWAQVVRYTLPEPDSGPLQVRFEPQPGGVRLIVDVLQPGGEPLDLARVNTRVSLPDGAQREFDVRQVAPGRYAQDLLLPADGPYVMSVVLLHNGQRQQVDIGYVQNVPAEYNPPLTSTRLQGRALLEQIAQMSGGRVLELSRGILGVPEVTAEPLAQLATSTALWPWFLGVALLVWLLEIAVRRGLFMRNR